MEKISLVITVRNEEKSIKKLLQSIKVQKTKPDEIIFVDAFSSDSTFKKLLAWKFREKKVFQYKGNRSQGRNFGIQKASYSVIAVTDAGCELDKMWLFELKKTLQAKKADVVPGFYVPNTSSAFQLAIAPLIAVSKNKLDEKTFLPSSRSLLFKKSIWKKAGKYPEELDTCEDLVFAERLRLQSNHWVMNSKALVKWDMPSTLQEFSKRVFRYALGDLQAGYTRHVRKITKASARALLLVFSLLASIIVQAPLVFLVLAIVYGLLSIFRHILDLRFFHPKFDSKFFIALMLLPIAQGAVDFALLFAKIRHTYDTSL